MDTKLKKGFGMGGIIARTLTSSLEDESLVPSSIHSQDEKWMTRALLQAMNGIGWASPNPSVGCVVVKNEKVIASGFTQFYGGKHAERMAFDFLEKTVELDRLTGLQVYVTLEPCSHFGKQPPCVDLLLHPSVKKVVIACKDQNPLVAGNGIQKLIEAGKEVQLGVLSEEAKAWHYPFLKFHQTKKPVWVAKWAENQNGLLADEFGNSKWITNSQSRAYTHWLRQKYDAILVGAGTWIKDEPKLNVRDCAEPHRRNPVILVHDPKKRLSKEQVSPAVHLFHQKEMVDFIHAVENHDFGFELQSVLCEGGSRTLNQLFRAGRVDLVHRFIGDKDFGALGPSSPHRIFGFSPETSNVWECATLSEFGNDLLQEWVKCC